MYNIIHRISVNTTCTEYLTYLHINTCRTTGCYRLCIYMYNMYNYKVLVCVYLHVQYVQLHVQLQSARVCVSTCIQYEWVWCPNAAGNCLRYRGGLYSDIDFHPPASSSS